jgi:hypothetical protein
MRRFLTLLALFAFSLLPLTAKEKQKKSPLPPSVLEAKTISIIIEPDAGHSLENPMANQTAQKDVEAAILKWGRFQPMLSTQNADLIIVIRKGTGHIADASISDPQNSGRPGSMTPSNDGVPVSDQRSNQPSLDNRPPPTNPGTPTTHGDITNTEDSFLVYDGHAQTPLNLPPIWRYNGVDGLRSHSVPAVDGFRKAVTETEKIAAAKNQ